MNTDIIEEERGGKHDMNMAFVLRLTWDNVAQGWRIILKPVDGSGTRVFTDLESVFLHIAGLCAQLHHLHTKGSGGEQNEKRHK